MTLEFKLVEKQPVGSKTFKSFITPILKEAQRRCGTDCIDYEQLSRQIGIEIGSWRSHFLHGTPEPKYGYIQLSMARDILREHYC